MADRARRIAVIQGHPDPHGHHFGHALAEADRRGANEEGHAIETVESDANDRRERWLRKMHVFGRDAC